MNLKPVEGKKRLPVPLRNQVTFEPFHDKSLVHDKNS